MPSRKRKPRSKFLFPLLPVLAVIGISLAAGGCELSPQEKRGYSSIPQNRPSAWENRPFGN